MLQTLRNAWKIPDLRRKILYTIFLLIVFRFGSVIPVPWVDKAAIQTWLSGSQGSTLFDLLDTFSGGSFSQATIFAMSISPYIVPVRIAWIRLISPVSLASQASRYRLRQ